MLKKEIEDFTKKKNEFEKFRENELKKIDNKKKINSLLEEKNKTLLLINKKKKKQ